MKTRILQGALRSVVLVAASSVIGTAVAELPDPPPLDAREFEFRVLLDGKKIGSHRYSVRSSGDKRLVDSEARFDVKFLFINAYSYRHSLSARWDGDCLESLEAQTDANGTKLSVSGTLRDAEFVVRSDGETESLPICAMNFAYWNPRILKQQKLLNPQTGEYLEIDVERTGEQQLDIDGRRVAADSYRILAKNMRIDLWYSQEMEWLVLDTRVRGGRMLRYVKTERPA